MYVQHCLGRMIAAPCCVVSLLISQLHMFWIYRKMYEVRRGICQDCPSWTCCTKNNVILRERSWREGLVPVTRLGAWAIVTGLAQTAQGLSSPRTNQPHRLTANLAGGPVLMASLLGARPRPSHCWLQAP